MMGGEIGVRSELEEGSLFWFELPVELADAGEVQLAQPQRRVIGLAPGQRAADGRPFRLLIADDARDSRELLVKLLGPLVDPAGAPGFELREARNGQKAIDAWQEWQPHLIWMDIRMPVLDGFQATQRIRALAKSQDSAPVVIAALTGKSFEEEREEILARGFDDFIRKPFHENEIFDALSSHLGVRFLYEREDAGAERVEAPGKRVRLIPADLAALPPDLLDRLEGAVVRINVALLEILLGEVRAHNQPLADALAHLAQDYYFDQILAVIQEAKEG
jgi:CheY-like chemotaxis protein